MIKISTITAKSGSGGKLDLVNGAQKKPSSSSRDIVL